MMGAVDQAPTIAISRRRKILISFFILFHFACLIAWILPKPSPIKTWLLGLSLPLPGPTREVGEQTSQDPALDRTRRQQRHRKSPTPLFPARLHRSILPDPPPSSRFKTSWKLTSVTSPCTVCLRQEAAAANSTVS